MTAATETPSRGSVSDEEASFALGQLGNFGRLQRGAMPPARAATVTDLALRLPVHREASGGLLLAVPCAHELKGSAVSETFCRLASTPLEAPRYML